MEWYEAVEVVTPHVVQISTPRCSGTGFYVSSHKDFVTIATAAHVVSDSHLWEEPIRIYHPYSGKIQILRKGTRAVLVEGGVDTAAVMFKPDDIPLPTQALSLAPEGNYLKTGNEVGWLGFPAISQSGLCFFTGRISTWVDKQKAYLIDGVVINGVSGGPTFAIHDANIYLVGVVSAYLPNRAMGETLPGLSVVREVGQFQQLVKEFKSLEEAAEKTQPAESPDKAPDYQNC